MITGIHVGIATKDIEAAYGFLRDTLGLPGYDAGGGFMIFEPQAVEVAVDGESDSPFTLAFFCDDLDATVKELEGHGVACARPFREEAWGRISEVTLPSGQACMLYQRKYARGNPIGG